MNISNSLIIFAKEHPKVFNGFCTGISIGIPVGLSVLALGNLNDLINDEQKSNFYYLDNATIAFLVPTVSCTALGSIIEQVQNIYRSYVPADSGNNENP